MDAPYWFPVATLVAGAVLTEVGYCIRRHREERKPFGKAIAELLELRHRIRGVNTVLAKIKNYVPTSPDVELVVRRILTDLMGQPKGLQDRYNEAVNLVASVDPILAFRLRSKDEFVPLLQKLRPLLDSQTEAKSLIKVMEETLSCAFLEKLDELIIDLAKAHGAGTWWRIRKRLSKQWETPDKLEEFLSLIQKHVAKTGEVDSSNSDA